MRSYQWMRLALASAVAVCCSAATDTTLDVTVADASATAATPIVEVSCGADASGVCMAQIEPSNDTSTPADMFQARKVLKHFIAKEQGEGVGARVRRSVGSYNLRNLDPFLMLDEFNVGLPGGFPDHPHRGFETVTYVLPTSKGHMLHEDFLGNKGELRPGDLQWMTPGRGIVHAEMPATTTPSHGLQLWVNLPKSKKMMDPRYQEISRDRVPHIFNDDKTVEAIIFAGEAFGKTGPIDPVAPMTYIHFIMEKGSKLEYKVPQGHHAFVYTLVGEATITDTKLTAHEAVVFEVEGDGIDVSADEAFEFIMISAEPLNEPIVQHGPFVMTTSEEIRQAFFDYSTGTNGFENAPDWESDLSRRRFADYTE